MKMNCEKPFGLVVTDEAHLACVTENSCAAGHIRGIRQAHLTDVGEIPGSSCEFASAAFEMNGISEDSEQAWRDRHGRGGGLMKK